MNGLGLVGYGYDDDDDDEEEEEDDALADALNRDKERPNGTAERPLSSMPLERDRTDEGGAHTRMCCILSHTSARSRSCVLLFTTVMERKHYQLPTCAFLPAIVSQDLPGKVAHKYLGKTNYSGFLQVHRDKLQIQNSKPHRMEQLQ